MVDIEADGPFSGDYSMVCFGAIIVEPSLSRTFYGRLRPVSDKWDPEALKISGFSREETLGFDSPKAVMESFDKWLADNVKGRPIFISDNNGFDWQFMVRLVPPVAGPAHHKSIGANHPEQAPAPCCRKTAVGIHP